MEYLRSSGIGRIFQLHVHRSAGWLSKQATKKLIWSPSGDLLVESPRGLGPWFDNPPHTLLKMFPISVSRIVAIAEVLFTFFLRRKSAP